jgi:hypothetical protein
MIIDFKDNNCIAVSGLLAVCKLLCSDRYTADIATVKDGKVTEYQGVIIESVDEEGGEPGILVSRAVAAAGDAPREPKPEEIAVTLANITRLSL